MIKSAIAQQKYNEPSKANILKVYDEIEKKSDFWHKGNRRNTCLFTFYSKSSDEKNSEM